MKNNRRIIVMVLALALALSLCLTGCGGGDGGSGHTGGGSGGDIIGVTLPNTSTTLNAKIGEAVTNIFPDLQVSVQSADNNVSSQIAHIDGFITMGAKMIVVVPTEIEAIQDTLKKAKDAGIKVVISGVSTDGIDPSSYDAVTHSNEFLVGSYEALLAKHWAESHLAGQSFGTLILTSDLNDDGIARSMGMQSITEPTLEGGGANPAYSELVAGNEVYISTMGLNQTGNELISAALTEHPDIRLILAYMSGVSPGMSQYIVDGNFNNEEFAIFSGGVQGNEAEYLIGSLPAAALAGIGTQSVFRGAVSFGGTDAAQGVADLAYKVFTGVEGTDYQKDTAETIGVWFVIDGEGEDPGSVAVFTVESPTVEDFDPAATLIKEGTVIKWPAE